MAKNKNVTDKFDLSSVKEIFTGAAPLGAETADELQKLHPEWKIRQGYGQFLRMKADKARLADSIRFDGNLHGRMLHSGKGHLVRFFGILVAIDRSTSRVT